MLETMQTNGGRQARIGIRFLDELDDIKIKRLLNKKSKDKESTEKLTNMITKHESWNEIKKDLIKASKEEVDEHGK